MPRPFFWLNLFLLCLMMIGRVTGLQAQKKFYFRLLGGYSMPTVNRLEPVIEFNTVAGSSIQVDARVERISLGRGIQLGGALGWMFSRHWGAEISALYHFSTGIDFSKEELFGQSSIVTRMEYTGGNLMLKAGMMVRGNPDRIITPFAGMGLALGLPQTEYSMTTQRTTTSPTGSVIREQVDRTDEYRGAPIVGYFGKLGLQIRLKPRWALIGELEVMAQRWEPDEGEVTSYTDQHGENLLAGLSEDQRTYTFSDQVRSDPGKRLIPPEAAAIDIPFSGLGMRLGLHVDF